MRYACKISRIIIFLLLLFIYLKIIKADDLGQNDNIIDELKVLSLEDLMDIDITSVSKKEQKISESAAAIYVITQKDIRRSGATSIMELLRMAPGLQVARIDSNKWAISSRGFNDRFSNKLLVLIDGRSIYTPFFAGVFWDQKDLILDDINRIEIIRGPGATLWGANAVNGVINIITKDAKDTHGVFLKAGSGSDERAFGSIRYGAKLENEIDYRVYAKYFNRDSFVNSVDHDAADGWEALRGGFRLDWAMSHVNSLMVTGDFYNGNRGNKLHMASLFSPFEIEVDQDSDFTGGHLMSRWDHEISDSSDMVVQFYYDRAERADEINIDIRDTFDIDFQHRFLLGKSNEIIWGLGYRFVADRNNGKFSLAVDPEYRGDNLFSAFVQDEIELLEDSLYLTLGSKFEHNDYTGFEFQPSGRIIWSPNNNHSIWSSISRAVRTPSRVEDDSQINSEVIPNSENPNRLPIVLALFGNHDFESENLMAYELGYKFRQSEKLFFEIAGFYNIYNNLRTLEPNRIFLETSPPLQRFMVPVIANNKMDGETYGIEIAVDYNVFNWLHLKGSYTFLDMQLHLDGDSRDFLSEGEEGNSPENQFTFWSYIDLPYNFELDAGFRYVDNLPAPEIESYITMDIRLGWKPKDNLEISIVGQNLLDSDHMEFTSSFFDVQPTEIERGVYGSIKWQF